MSTHGAAVRVSVRVRPGASRTRVGGAYGDSLVVAVTAPPVDGRATEACLRAVAEALGVAPRSVRLISGLTNRTKILEVDGDRGVILARLAQLMGG